MYMYGHSSNLCMQDAHQEVIVSRKRKEEAKKRKEELVCHTNFKDDNIVSLSLFRRNSERGHFRDVAVVCSSSQETDSLPTSLRMLNLMNLFLY